VTDSFQEVPGAGATTDLPGFGQTTRASTVYALGSIVAKLVGLLMLPILTRSLTPAGFGAMDVLQSLESALLTLLLLGLDVATLRLYFDQPDLTSRRRLIGTSYAIGLTVTLVAAVVIVLAAGWASASLFGSPTLRPAFMAVAVAVVAEAIKAIAGAVLRGEGRAGWFAALSGGTTIAYAVLTVGLLTLWRADASAVLVAYAAAMALAALTVSYLIRAEAFGKPSVAAGRALLRLGLPLAPAAAAVYVGSFLNRTILLGAGGTSEVAYFSVAQRFASVAAIVVTAFALAWPPRAYSLGTSVAARARLAADARWIVAMMCAAVILVAMVSPEVLVLTTGRAYSGALSPLGFCLIAVLMDALFLVASLPSALAKATQDLALAIGAAVITGIIGNLALAPVWHSTGTAAAVAAGELVGVVVVRRLAMRRLPLPVNWLRVGILSAVTAFAAEALLASGASPAVRFLVGAATLVLIASSVPLRPTITRLWARLSP